MKAYWAWVPATNDTTSTMAASTFCRRSTGRMTRPSMTWKWQSLDEWFRENYGFFLKNEKPDGPAVTHTTVGWCVDIEIHDTGMGPDTKVWLLEQGCEVQIFSKQHLTDWFIDQHLKPKRSLHKVIPFACQPTQQAPPSHCFHDGLGPFFGDCRDVRVWPGRTTNFNTFCLL